MRAAWYEEKGSAAQVLVVGDMPDPEPAPGEVRVRLAYSGINSGDVKKRSDWLGFSMVYPRIIPHSDGAGIIDTVGAEVSASRVGERVWVFGAQSYRPFGTAAEYTVVPAGNAVPLPDGTDFAIGACLGISARTAHRCVFADGPVTGKHLLIAGGAGNVGNAAIAFATWGGALVLATVGSNEQRRIALQAGAADVIDRHTADLAGAILRWSGSHGVDRILEVAFGANIALDEQVIANGGIIATYASDGAGTPEIPFWFLVFKNVVIRFIGSDDLPSDAEHSAVQDITTCLAAGRLHPRIAATFPLDRIAEAHQLVEHGANGHVLLALADL